MGEAFFAFLVFIGVIAIAGVLFCGWAIFCIAKGLLRLVNGATGATHRAAMAQLRPCSHIRCGQMNPVGARFCRRCGRSMAGEVVMTRNRVAAA